MLYETERMDGGKLVDLTVAGEVTRDCRYASLTAPELVRCEVWVDGRLHDVVYAGAGGSHSWWTYGGGKLLPQQGLRPGQRLEILVDGPAALRVDWDDE